MEKRGSLNNSVECSVPRFGKALAPMVTAVIFSLLVALSGDMAAASTGSITAKGGGVSPSRPKVLSAQCWLDQGLSCFGDRTVRPGQPLLLTGKNFSRTAEIVFRPARSKKAKKRRGSGRIARSKAAAVVKTSSIDNSQLEASVPMLRQGKYLVQVRNSSGLQSNPKSIKVLARPQIKPGNTPRIVDAVAKFRRFYSGGTQPQAFVFQVSSLQSTVQANVELVEIASGTVLRQWNVDAKTNKATNVTWDGSLINGDAAPEGRYQFRLQVSDSAGNVTTSTGSLAGKEAKKSATFSYQKYVFPIQGSYFMGRGRSAGHDGVDVMAKRGTPLVAVTSGKIEYVGNHGRAGIYLIISGFDNKRYFYLHMNERPLVSKGDRVSAGQRIGSVGNTGNTSDYHLHFEVRDKAGKNKRSWFGRTLDPKKFLLGIAR